MGSKKNPIWRVVVADQRSPRDGRFIETIGRYNPQTNPSTIAIDEERLDHWLALGAQPTGAVKQLLKAQAKSGGAQVAEPEPEPAEPEPEAAEPDPEAAEPQTAPAEPQTAPAAAEPVAAEPEPAPAEPEPAAAPGPAAGGGEPESAPPAEPAETDPAGS